MRFDRPKVCSALAKQFINELKSFLPEKHSSLSFCSKVFVLM